MDAPSTSAKSAPQAHQKRVLPSRSRRGGPGVGNCDADLMILETQKRRFENEPLIPADTQFLLTTNSALVAKSSTSLVLGINTHANDRYFDRPEVLKAYREQEIIQTPEFVKLADSQNVGGRFRPRDVDDGTTDTSDAAYEKRHRKYETFEKRQRLREKEKLKHEQYKLKERIEQLRAMDAGAFLALPASSFSAAPAQIAEDSEGSSPVMHVNGAAPYSEGERRRKEMLDIASVLEERYKVLLPPDRIRKIPGQSAANTSAEPEGSAYMRRSSRRRYDDDESDEEPFVNAAKKEVEKLKLKIKFPRRTNTATSQSSTSVAKAASFTKRRKSLPLLLGPSRIATTSNVPAPSDPASLHLDTNHLSTSSAVTFSASPQPNSPILDSKPVSLPPTPMSNPEIAVLEAGTPGVTVVPSKKFRMLEQINSSDPGAMSRPYKRIKISPMLPSSSRNSERDPSVPPIESISAPILRRSVPRSTASKQYVSYISTAGRAERTNSSLVVAAIRSSGNMARKAKRHVTAFGVKLRSEIFEEAREFELPAWVHPSRRSWEVESQASAFEHEVIPAKVSSDPEPSIDGSNFPDTLGDVP